jgi:6-pyruvoyltetrahydropterin/6-carboxytetrahydropterin synthase
MAYTITKVFKIDVGHRTWTQDMRKGRGKEFYSESLPYPYNKCANIHGHSLLIYITLESDTLDEQNFVMDTDLIKVPVGRIIEKMDHSFIIDKNDPLFEDIKKIIEKENLRLYIVDFSPSFEALAKYFYDEVKKIIQETPYKSEIRVKQVKITGEHMTVEATYSE